MKRENFLEKTTISNNGQAHTFKAEKEAVDPEMWEISFVNIDTDDTTVAISFLDFDGGPEYAQDLASAATVAAGGSFDMTFETSHKQCKVTLTNASLAIDKAVDLRCIAGPRNGGVNGKSHSFVAAAT